MCKKLYSLAVAVLTSIDNMIGCPYNSKEDWSRMLFFVYTALGS